MFLDAGTGGNDNLFVRNLVLGGKLYWLIDHNLMSHANISNIRASELVLSNSAGSPLSIPLLKYARHLYRPCLIFEKTIPTFAISALSQES